jgi:integrase
MRIKLTERVLPKLKAPDPSGKQTLHFDVELKGFGVLCSGKSNSRTFIAQRTLPNGRTRRVTVGGVNEISVEVARQRAANLLDDLRRGLDPKRKSAGSATLGETLEAYLVARKDLRPASVRLYRIVVSRYLAPWRDISLNSITPETVEERHRRIAATVARTNKLERNTGQTAANLSMRVLRALFSFAADRDPELGPNPVRRLKKAWYPEHRRTRLVQAEALPAFYKAVRELDNGIARDFLLLVMFTGARLHEARSLTWSDIDLQGRIIRFPAASTKAGRKLDLPMSDVVHGLLVARRALGNAHFVFPGRTNKHLRDPSFVLKQVAAKTGIQISCHDLRRTFCTIAESCDVSPLALKALINHSLGRGVTEGYIQMSVERLRAPMQTIADRLKELCQIVEPSGANLAKLA